MRERDTTITIACLLIALASFALPAMADEGDGALEGEVDIAYRNVSIDGSERKYDEDYDGLESGFFLGSLVSPTT